MVKCCINMGPVIPLAKGTGNCLFRRGSLGFQGPLLYFFKKMRGLFRDLRKSASCCSRERKGVVPVLGPCRCTSSGIVVGCVGSFRGKTLSCICGTARRRVRARGGGSLCVPLVGFKVCPALSRAGVFHFFCAASNGGACFLPRGGMFYCDPGRFFLTLDGDV